MEESEFLSAICVRIQAAEPVLWIQTDDDAWLAMTIKNALTAKQIPCEITEAPSWDASNARRVFIWQPPTAADILAHERDLARLLRQMRAQTTCVILVPRSLHKPTFLDPVPLLDAPLPDWNARRTLISLALGSLAKDPRRLERIAAVSAGLSRVQISRILARCLVEARETQNFDDWEKRVVQEKRQLLADNLSLDVIDDPATIQDLGGADDLKQWLQLRASAFTQDAQNFGIQPPRGLLLVGIQGCGKSLAAKAIANTWKFPLLQLDMSAIFSTAQAPDAVLRQALAVADAMSPAVIWCDEIEKAFAQDADPTTRRLLGHILNWMQERRSTAFFVATANDISHLPAELMRQGRFDATLFLDLPTDSARRDIFAIHLRKRKRDPSQFDLAKLAQATQNFSGAEIEQTIIAALFSAFSKRSTLTTDHILDAAHDIVPLYKQREHEIKQLREWASERTRMASADERLLSFFS